jgi:hypothetical protein
MEVVSAQRRNHLQILRTITPSFCITALNYLSSAGENAQQKPCNERSESIRQLRLYAARGCNISKNPHPKPEIIRMPSLTQTGVTPAARAPH